MLAYQKPTLIGNLTKLLHLPCALDPLLLVEVSAQVAASLFWTYETPVWKTAVESATGHSWLCNLKGVAKAVEEEKPSFISKVRRSIFKLDARLDQGGWYYFLASLAEEGLMDFTSSLLKAGRCDRHDFKHRGVGSQAIGGWPGGEAGRWLDNMVWRNPDWPDTPQAVSGIEVPPGGGAWIVGHARLEATNGVYLPSISRIIIKETGQVLDTDADHKQDLENVGITQSWAAWKNETSSTRTMMYQVSPQVPTFNTQVTTALGGYGSSGSYG